MIEPGTQHLSDYLAVLRRRKRQILFPATVIFLASVALAFGLPPVYRSTATILIEEELVTEDLVASTAAGFANERIELITRRLLTVENLRGVVEKLDLYPEERRLGNDGAIIGRLRANILIQTVKASVTDRQSGKAGTATIAFTISFSADTPDVAHKVTNELVELYLSENLRIRTQKAETTHRFLADEERRIVQQITELEAKLATHKEENLGRLPELTNLNMRLMERAEQEMEEAKSRIYTLEERKMYLEAQLSQLEPYTGQSPAARLRELHGQYLRAAAFYAPNHPDVAKLRREIELLKKELGVIDEKEVIADKLRTAQAELGAARKKYGEEHPDVRRLKRSVETLEQTLWEAATSAELGFTLKPDNPAYISIQTQLDGIRLNLRAANEQRLRAQQKLVEYEQRLTQGPRVEQRGLALGRAYESTTREHREIKEKLVRAELALELERKQGGQRYSLLEPPNLPGAPVEPNRRAILALGIVLAVGSGIGYASLAEYMDRTVRGSKNVRALLGAPPLAVIPHIDARKTGHQKRRVA